MLRWLHISCLMLVLPDYEAKDRIYHTLEIISQQGYHAEKHEVVTSDGYILELHRIPYRRHLVTAEKNRPVVLLMHGLSSSSDTYIYLGREHAIGYNLADAGFDVWMGNARGTKSSRRHITINPDEEPLKFFDFTWEEIGYYDVSCMVDYILNYTSSEKLHYIGHSQGGTVFLVLNSMRPEYNEKFASAHLMAGVGYQSHFPAATLRALAALTDVIYPMAFTIGAIELFPAHNKTNLNTIPIYPIISKMNISSLCRGILGDTGVCSLLGLTRRTDPGLQPSQTMPPGRHPKRYTYYIRGGGSLKQVAHYGQNIRDRAFRRWNYGSIKNKEVYGTSVPPYYDLKLIDVRTTMHYTISDILLDERDVLAMASDMPNTIVRKVARSDFLHEDFVVADDAKELVTDFIIKAINEIAFVSKPTPTTKSSHKTEAKTEQGTKIKTSNEQIETLTTFGKHQDQMGIIFTTQTTINKSPNISKSFSAISIQHTPKTKSTERKQTPVMSEIFVTKDTERETPVPMDTETVKKFEKLSENITTYMSKVTEILTIKKFPRPTRSHSTTQSRKRNDRTDTKILKKFEKLSKNITTYMNEFTEILTMKKFSRPTKSHSTTQSRKRNDRTRVKFKQPRLIITTRQRASLREQVTETHKNKIKLRVNENSSRKHFGEQNLGTELTFFHSFCILCTSVTLNLLVKLHDINFVNFCLLLVMLFILWF